MKIENHDGILVVRDDLIGLGGTKTRVLKALMNDSTNTTFVYASPRQGSAQIALADAASQLGRKAVIFTAKSKHRHIKTIKAEELGATIIEVAPGYLNVVQARAREYCKQTGAYLVPFGGYTEHISVIEQAARELNINPTQVWCAAGSGTLAKQLHKAWPNAQLNAVQVGKELKDIPGTVHVWPHKFDKGCKEPTPFPADSYYEAKAWQVCKEKAKPGAVFWNVAGN